MTRTISLSRHADVAIIGLLTNSNWGSGRRTRLAAKLFPQLLVGRSITLSEEECRFLRENLATYLKGSMGGIELAHEQKQAILAELLWPPPQTSAS